MIGALFSFASGRLSLNSVKGVVLAWLVGEIVAFCLAVKLLGLGLTLLAMLATSVLGVMVLRRIGLEAAQQLRRRMMSGGSPNDAFIDGTLTAFGAMLLILPGFVSDAVGLALASPSIRQSLAARLLRPGTAPRPATPGRRAAPDVIDLSPEDWRVVDKSNRG